MESHIHHWEQDKGIRVTIYLVCIVAIVFSIAFSVYILR